MDAANGLGVKKTKKGFAGGWHWSLPAGTPNNSASSGVHAENPNETREFSEDAEPQGNSATSSANHEDAELSSDNSATTANPFSPNPSNYSGDSENPEDAEFRDPPDDGERF
jgi:hypothetical protein